MLRRSFGVRSPHYCLLMVPEINDNRFGLPFVPIDCDKGGKGNANH